MLIKKEEKMMSKRKKKGFTLIELIVVIAILGILAAIAVPKFATVTDNAKNKSALSENRIAVSAVQMYQSENNGTLPTATTDIDPYIQGGTAKLTLTTFTFAAGKVTVTTVSTASTPATTAVDVE